MKFLLVLSILFPCSLLASNYEDLCFKRKNGDFCYQQGVKTFMTLDTAKNPEEIKSIKDKAAKFFANGCDFNHQPSCYELGRYHIQAGDTLLGKITLEQSCKTDYQPACDELN